MFFGVCLEKVFYKQKNLPYPEDKTGSIIFR